MTTNAQKKATKTFIEKNDLVEIKFRVKRPKKEEYKKMAELLGYSSFNQFVIDAIESKLGNS